VCFPRCSGTEAQIQAVVDAGLLTAALTFLKPVDREALLFTDSTIATYGRPVLQCAAIAAAEAGAEVAAAAGHGATSGCDLGASIGDEAVAQSADSSPDTAHTGTSCVSAGFISVTVAPGKPPPGVYFLAGSDGEPNTVAGMREVADGDAPVLDADLTNMAAWLIGNCADNDSVPKDAALAGGAAAACREVLASLFAQLHELDAEARKDGSVVLLHPRVEDLLHNFAWTASALANGAPEESLEQLRPLVALGAVLTTCCDHKVATRAAWFVCHIAENPGWTTMVSAVRAAGSAVAMVRNVCLRAMASR
jgi:hypothetical protein